MTQSYCISCMLFIINNPKEDTILPAMKPNGCLKVQKWEKIKCKLSHKCSSLLEEEQAKALMEDLHVVIWLR